MGIQSLAILPEPIQNTSVRGIFQGDVIIKSAIIAALAEARTLPWVLDYTFANLPQDTLTNTQYGQADVEMAKKWFLSTDVPIVMDLRLDKATWPVIAISLLDSVESEFSLGDVHYVPYEGTFADWPIIAGPFTPTSYSPSTGMMRIPDAAIANVVMDGGMVLIDAAGRAFPVREVLDTDLVSITPNTLADFKTVIIKDGNPGLITPIESVRNRESYQIMVLGDAESTHAIYLHSILYFMLNRKKETLLEFRGFDRSTISSGKVERFQPAENQVVYGRTINLVGYVQQSWIKDNKQVIQGVSIGAPGGGLTVGLNGSSGPGLNDKGVPATPEDSWTVDHDVLSFED